MKLEDLPSPEYIRRVMRFAQPVEPIKERDPNTPAKWSCLKGRPKAKDITKEEVAEMRRLKFEGLLNKEIAARLGRSCTAVQKHVTDITKATKGEVYELQRRIKHMRSQGATHTEIMKATGATKGRVKWAIKRMNRVERKARPSAPSA